MQSVETNFDSKAFTEIGFRRDHAYSSPVDAFADDHERISEHLLEAESEGDVQDEVESAMLAKLLDQLEKIEGDLADASAFGALGDQTANFCGRFNIAGI